ncbi:MAG: SRPBCC family protein [Deltaproteobacteria bacterium]|nr:SRPBCC family protein [Deltaproteobacteria bacterium]
MNEVRIQQMFAVPPARLFAVVTDHRNLGKYMTGAEVTIEREGKPPPNGLGTVRKVKARGLAIYEEVVRWEEPKAMDYRVIRGAPLRNHLGEIRLTPTPDGGTQVDYRIQFSVPWYFGGGLLGSYLAREFESTIGKCLAMMAAEVRGAA